MHVFGIPRFSFILSFVALLSGAHPAWGRLATPADAPALISFYDREVTIEASGKSQEIIEKRVKILNEAGRTTFAVERFVFHEGVEKIELIEAKTIREGKVCVVPAHMIETKPLASDGQGFDQLYQLLVSYPNVRVGDEVCIKVKVTTNKQAIPGYFACYFSYGHGAMWQHLRVRIRSQLPLQLVCNDPHGVFKINERKDGRSQVIEVQAQKPAYGDLFNESDLNQIHPDMMTWVGVSTHKDFVALGAPFVADYERVLKQNLPPLYEKIREAALPLQGAVAQINAVTTELQQVRYMGDWRTIQGRYCPRDLSVVASSGVGDCKDFATALAAILRALGYQADVALVTRGGFHVPAQKKLVSVQSFNHAIVKVVTPEGCVLWVDPTNFTSMADGIYPDIADRPALVLKSKQPSYEMIPPVDPAHAKIAIHDALEVQGQTTLVRQGRLHLTGEQAESLTGAGLSNSPQTIAEGVTRMLTGNSEPQKKVVKLPPLTSRVVQGVTIHYTLAQENEVLLSTSGPGILLGSVWVAPFMETKLDQVGTTCLGIPATFERTIVVKNVGVARAKSLEYQVKTPWLEATRTCEAIEGGVKITERAVIRKSFVTATDVRTKQFQELKNRLKMFCTQVALILDQQAPVQANPAS